MRLLGRAHDKDFWAQVREKEVFKQYVKRCEEIYAEKKAEGDLRSLKYSEFKLFWTTGDRAIYQAPYFSRRIYMENAALLCLIYPEEQEYLDTLMDIIYAICDEYTWCLPAHQGQLEPNNNVRIDLFAAETGFALAEIYTLLEDRLEGLIKNRIIAEIDRRIVKPFAGVENYGWWENGRLNWTAVCMGSVSNTLMLMRPDLVDEKYIARLKKSLDGFLTGFDSDGICFEGSGYWGYGFGFFVMCAEMARTFTNGELDYFKLDKVRKIATFHQKMFLSGNANASFSDSGPTLNQPTYLIHFLKKEYPDDILVYDKKYSLNGVGKFCQHMRTFLWFNEEAAASPATNDVEFEMYADEAQWMIKKTAAYGFAAKGGDNKEFHNHNDVGSFVFAKEGRHIFTDPGGGKYTRQYFALDTRYTTVECSSRGHSVPMIGDICQSYGKEFAAKDAKYESGVFSLDLAGAYECEGLNSIKRSFAFTEDKVTLTDTFDYTGEGKLVQRLVTSHAPEKVTEGNIKVDIGGVLYDPAICEVKISDEPLSKGGKVYYIDFILNADVNSSTVTLY